MNLWIEAYTVLLECILTFYSFHRMIQPSYPSRRILGSIYLIYFFLDLHITLYIPLLPRLMILLLFLFACYHLILKESALKVIYCLIVFTVIMAIADLLSGGILSLMGISIRECLGTGTGRFIYNTTAKIMHLFLLVLFVTLTQCRYDSRALRRAVPLILCNAASFFIMATQFESFISSERHTPFIISTLAVLLINTVICVYTELEKHYYELQEQHRLMEQRLSHQQQYYQDAVRRQEESRALWHDMKKYMLAMEALISSSHTEEMERNLSPIKEKLGHLGESIHTGNQMIDGILNYGLQKAHEARLKINFNLWLDAALRFPATDFYVILGNTIDNAIEACSTFPVTEEALIRITLRQKNHALLYEISNPIPASPVKKTGSIHGYGLENVKECVRRNQGTISICTDNGIFRVTVTLTVS